ncbi:nuclear transport factor 2 family protein [Arcicella sp. DC2W]|uniref:Nuclear transport factor 2 family protein n=1 Tax=Arcicella gelida TaxID=2984195 RepID=A0ABU5S448_9BACT|nr:nuclear transport factor 2 family protein [Arcicella sp. DC2W]MEA5403190.1 nuclear transport factor 2 family protein [Arcicella sp. DC2W]
MKTLSIIVSLLFVTQFSMAQQNSLQQDSNRQLIKEGFEKWANGSGSFFDLLAEDVHWTISGSSYLSKTYTSKKQLIDEVLNPLNDRLSQKIIPTIREIFVDNNTVIAIWDGKATALDGKPYNVSYAWFMEIQHGKIVKVTAFLDTLDLEEIFKRVKVAKK